MTCNCGYELRDIKSILRDLDRSTWTTSENRGKLSQNFAHFIEPNYPAGEIEVSF